VITGCTSGLGLKLAEELSKKKATLILACRDLEKARKIRDRLIVESGNSRITVEQVDFTSLQSVQELAERIIQSTSRIFALVNNVGIFYHPSEETKDNLEITFQTNYLSHFLLTLKLLPLLREQEKDARIIFVGSKAHLCVDRCPQKELHQTFEDSRDNRFLSYQYSKFCLTLFGKRLSNILSSPTHLSVHCVDPGNVETQIFRHFPQLSNPWLYLLQKPLRLLLIKTPLEGIQGILFALLSDKKPGFYIEGIENSERYNPLVLNPLLGDILWQLSRQIVEARLN
jgi:retinol dehydrogenase-12